jgi:4,4'-diaponeurosporenoate glycosyltransferase
MAGLLNNLSALSAPPKEIIVVDDLSTDSTVKIAKTFTQVTTVSLAENPEGWIGKTWACQTGAQLAACFFLPGAANHCKL